MRGLLALLVLVCSLSVSGCAGKSCQDKADDEWHDMRSKEIDNGVGLDRSIGEESDDMYRYEIYKCGSAS